MSGRRAARRGVGGGRGRGWGGTREKKREREREREICKLHKFVVERRRPQGEIQHDARAAECLGRSLGRSVARSVRLSVARPQTAHLTWLLCSFPRSPALPLASSRRPPSFPPSLPLPSVVCCRSIGEENAHWSVAVVARCLVRRASPRPFRDLGSFSLDRRTNERRAVATCISEKPKPTGLPYPFETSARKRLRKQPARLQA